MFNTKRSIWFAAMMGLLLIVAAVSAERTALFRSTEKAFYASERTVDFVRPGLVLKVTKVEIASEGTINATVKITDPRGLPLDRLGVTTPGPVTLSFLIGTIPANETQYISYITRQRTAEGRTVTQATGESTGAWREVAIGEYVYTFLNKAPSSIDRNATHTVGVYGSRNLTEFDLGTNRADTVFNFVPSGAAVTKVRDVVRTASCNKCHSQLAFHGGNRRSMEVCNLCHTPQTPDPATQNTTDMKVMIHKIHMGAELPSVVGGGKYGIGTHDYSDIGNPSPNMACGVCHEPQAKTGATQADNWKTNPTREACGSCHDKVNFATGEGHAAGPQISDNQCSRCHPATAADDFDTSVPGAHVVPEQSKLLGGVVFTLDSVADAAPGKNPIVTFTLKDREGKPIVASTMTNLRIYMAGPTTDLPDYIREDVRAAQGPGDGRYFYTFTAPIPATAKGSFMFGIEGYRNATLLAGTVKQRTVRDIGLNKVITVSVDGSPVVRRRASVSTEKCNSCHYSLSFHGGNRNTVEMCTFCHNPNLVEGADRESFNLSTFLHRAHSADVRYPGVLTDCAQCHVTNGNMVPLPQNLLPVQNGHAPASPVMPETNACTSCHNTPAAWSHATVNTSAIGESCSVCHGATGPAAVNRVHAQ